MSLEPDEKALYALKLRAIRRLIEAGWCRGMEAIDDRGIPTHHRDPRAVQFCLDGACRRAQIEDGPKAKDGVYLFLRRARPGQETNLRKREPRKPLTQERHHFNLVAWNDAPGRTKEEVLTLIDRAIELVQES